MQTLYASLCARRPAVTYRRARWETPDGDFIELDWVVEPCADASRFHLTRRKRRDQDSVLQNSGQKRRPLVALFHGLEGSSRSHYALALMAAVRDAGWRGVVVHFRGCGGEPNRLPRAYHSGDSAEIDWIVRRLRGESAHAIRRRRFARRQRAAQVAGRNRRCRSRPRETSGGRVGAG